MKRTTTLTIIILCLSIAAIAQTVQQTHMAFQTTKTATWCNPCGTWAWPMQESIVATNSAHAVCVELHYSSSDVIYSNTAGTVLNDFPYVGSTPAWYLNGLDRTAYSSGGGIYPTTTQNTLHNCIDSTFAVLPDVQSAYTFSLSGNTLTVNTNTKFFNTVSGTYFLAIYMIENNVIAYQNGIGNNASHQNVLRKSMSTSSFGEQIATGTTTANTIIPHTFTATIDAGSRPCYMWLAAVIWKVNGTSYDYVNAYTNRAPVGVNDLSAQGIGLSVFPNPMAAEGKISLTIDHKINQCNITLMDMLGRNVASVYSGTLYQGHYDFSVEPGKLTNGIYFVNINADGITESRKILIEQ